MEGLLRIVAVLSLSLGVACTTRPEVDFDERDDFSRYRTWDWYAGVAGSIDAPGTNAAELDLDMARLVERALERLGFERVRGRSDLRVGVKLEVRREEVITYETGAMEQLSSLHFEPSYQVQATVERRRTYEHSRLVIFAIDPLRRRVVWRGVLQERFPGQFSPHLQRTVASLMERFPPAGRAAPDAPPPARDPASGRPSEYTGSPARSVADNSS
jgi:hypothetical protein